MGASNNLFQSMRKLIDILEHKSTPKTQKKDDPEEVTEAHHESPLALQSTLPTQTSK